MFCVMSYFITFLSYIEVKQIYSQTNLMFNLSCDISMR